MRTNPTSIVQGPLIVPLGTEDKFIYTTPRINLVLFLHYTITVHSDLQPARLSTYANNPTPRKYLMQLMPCARTIGPL